MYAFINVCVFSFIHYKFAADSYRRVTESATSATS